MGKTKKTWPIFYSWADIQDETSQCRKDIDDLLEELEDRRTYLAYLNQTRPLKKKQDG